ncbi:MAG: RNA polymerase sigma factor [Phycisphaerae bacterium]|nr:RNA polymerase sigma factor [Phycisphaerae bacterium]
MVESHHDQLRIAMLVLRSQLGDKLAFVQLWERYRGPLGGFVRRIVLPAAETDDVLQDIWLTAWRKIGTLKVPGAFPAWLYGLARKKCYQALRKALRRLPPWVRPPGCGAGDDPVDLAEHVAQVQVALDGLGAEHRQVLVLRFFQNMPYHRIAEAVVCNVGTVKSRLHFAKRSLKAIMERMDHDRSNEQSPRGCG